MKAILRKDKAHIIFVVGFLLFLSGKLCMSLIPIWYRSAPVEPDDAYSYILKAEQLNVDDSPAVEDLKAQLTLHSADPYTSFLRYKYYLRLINHYHSLHSFLLMGLNKAGFSWEQAYSICQVLGICFFCIAAAYWLYVIWGAEASGIAMIFLSFIRFSGHGINEIVPSNLSLGIAILSWAIVMARKEFREWAAFFLIVAMLAMHPISRIYAMITLILYMVSTERPYLKKSFYFLGMGLCVIVLASVAPWFFSVQEQLSQTENLFGFLFNLRPVIESFLKWSNAFGGYISTFFMVLTGYICLSPAKRKDAVWTGNVLLCLLFLSVFYVLPNYPGHLFERMLVPFGIFVAGAVGKSVFEYFSLAVSWFLNKNKDENPNTNCRIEVFNRLSNRSWSLVIIGLIGGLFIYNIGVGSAQIIHVAKTKIFRQQRFLNPSQPELLLSNSKSADTVLYTGETPMFYYLSHGASRRGAVCYPILQGTPDEDIWVDKNKSIQYIVAWNPIQEGFVYLTSDKALNMESDSSVSLSAISLLIENIGKDGVVILSSTDSNFHLNEKNFRLNVPAKFSGWIKCPVDWEVSVDSVVLKSDQDSRTMKLKGMRIDDGQKTSLFWPWDKGIRIDFFRPDGEKSSAVFNAGNLFPNSNRKIKILSDEGFSVLAEVAN